MELLIVVALLAMVLTLSLPSLRKLSAKSELRNAARQLRVTLLEARLAAIDSGDLTYFRYQPGGGRFEVRARVEAGHAPAAKPTGRWTSRNLTARLRRDGDGRR